MRVRVKYKDGSAEVGAAFRVTSVEARGEASKPARVLAVLVKADDNVVITSLDSVVEVMVLEPEAPALPEVWAGEQELGLRLPSDAAISAEYRRVMTEHGTTIAPGDVQN